MSLNTSAFANIIFDLGGVILNIDYNLSVQAFEKLGLNQFDSHFSQAKQKELFDLYEKGHISSTEFRNQLKKQLNENVTDKDIDNAWNSLLLDLPKERLLLLEEIQKTHRTFLLSNTNEIHILEFNNYLAKTFDIPNLSGYFEKAYLSYEIGMRKPDAEIFEFVINQNKLNPLETLFIDDSIQHIESADALGIQTHWLKSGTTILDLFQIHDLS
ncbi:MAG: HAD family phosphatase [Bacteroidia bacterium]|nr:HAD family phosphatase [Bacteroidia bacterium]